KLGEDVPAVQRILRQIVIRAATHADEVILAQAEARVALREECAEEQRHVAELLQYGAALARVARLQRIAVKQGQRPQAVLAVLPNEKMVRAAETFENVTKVPAGVFKRRGTQLLRVMREALAEIIAERRFSDRNLRIKSHATSRDDPVVADYRRKKVAAANDV